MKQTTKTLSIIALMTAFMCILGPFSIPIPFSPVPISFTMIAIFLALYLLGMKKGVVSLFLYLLIGLIGLPVFSRFKGGPGKLLGPTGGYLIGFVFMAVISGFFIDKWFTNKLMCLIGMVLVTIVCYLFGTFWLAYQGSMSFQAALAAGVLPYIPFDLIKIIIALLLGPLIHTQLKRANLI